MKARQETFRYIGFRALADGSRRFDFSVGRTDGSSQRVSVKATHELFAGPGHIALQECPGICYETLKHRVVDDSGAFPASISLTPDDIAQHRKIVRSPGRKA